MDVFGHSPAPEGLMDAPAGGGVFAFPSRYAFARDLVAPARSNFGFAGKFMVATAFTGAPCIRTGASRVSLSFSACAAGGPEYAFERVSL
jgi:hypothetical protein